MNETMAKNRTFFWALIVLWGALILWNLFTPHETFSEYENRELKAFPRFTVGTFINGTFMADVNAYLSDHFAGRHIWVSSQSLIEYATGKRELNSVYIGKNALQGDVLPPDADKTAKNAAGINSVAERYNIPTYVMLVPSSTAMQPQNLPAFASGWDEPAYIMETYAKLGPSVTAIDVSDIFWQHRDEPLYYRTDHHWTSYGAFLASSQLAAAMGFPPFTMPDMDVSEVNDEFYGTFHSKTGFPLLDPDTIELYQSGKVASYEVYTGTETKTYPSIYFGEFLGKKDKYSYFLGQVQPVVTIRTGSESGKKLILFKDSYAHSLVPMLLDDFSEIRLVDLRYMNPNDLHTKLEVANYDAALFLYSTDVFSHQLGPGLLSLGN